VVLWDWMDDVLLVDGGTSGAGATREATATASSSPVVREDPWAVGIDVVTDRKVGSSAPAVDGAVICVSAMILSLVCIGSEMGLFDITSVTISSPSSFACGVSATTAVGVVVFFSGLVSSGCGAITETVEGSFPPVPTTFTCSSDDSLSPSLVFLGIVAFRVVISTLCDNGSVSSVKTICSDRLSSSQPSPLSPLAGVVTEVDGIGDDDDESSGMFLGNPRTTP